MKKILGLTVAALLVMGLVGGGTWAYFSDPETTTGNVLTAGTLNLQVGTADPTTANITVSAVAPGDSGSADWLLKNDGTLAGYLDITFTSIVDAENGVNEPEEDDVGEDGTVASPGTDGELAENLLLLIYIDENDNNTYDAGTDNLTFNDYVKGGSANLTDVTVDDYAMAANYGSGDDKAFRIEWSVSTSVTNLIQSDSTGFTIEFSLEQTAD